MESGAKQREVVHPIRSPLAHRHCRVDASSSQCGEACMVIQHSWLVGLERVDYQVHTPGESNGMTSSKSAVRPARATPADTLTGPW